LEVLLFSWKKKKEHRKIRRVIDVIFVLLNFQWEAKKQIINDTFVSMLRTIWKWVGKDLDLRF